MTEGRAAEGRPAEGRATDGPATESRASDERATTGRASDDRATDRQATDRQATDRQATDRQATQGRAAEGWATHGRAAAGRTTNGPATDDPAAESPATDNRATETRATDSRAAEGRAALGPATEGRPTEARPTDDPADNDRATDSPAAEGWAADLGTFLDAAGRGERRRLDESALLVTALEEMVLGSPRRYTRAEVLERAGLTDDEGTRLWRSLGFPEVPADLASFTDRDVEAAELLNEPVARALPADVREAVIRAIAQSMSRLADWQVGMLARMLADRAGEVPPAEALQLTAGLLPVLEQVQAYIWRRHLAAAVSRFVVGPLDDPASTESRTLAVGFADMVGFTRTTRRRSPAELAEMIARFEAATTEVIADAGGRIVKTVGDEVLFVADDIGTAAALAVRLRDRVRAEPALPRLRTGLAAGEVLQRFGDVYGETVNIAARLTTHARPDTILVDRTVAESLRDDDRWSVHKLRPLQVRGYRHLQPYVLRERE